MQSKELLQTGIQTAYEITLPLLEDMKDAPLTFPTPNGGNHPTWVAGHLAFGIGQVIWETMLGKPNPLADWSESFAGSTEPHGDAHRYPPYEEVLTKLRSIHQQSLGILSEMSEADLDQPSKQCPEELQSFFGTCRQCFLAMVIHFANHRGQVADARRVLGRTPILA